MSSRLDDQLRVMGLMFAAEHGATAVATGAALAIGFVTSSKPLIALRRTYSSSGNLLTVNLYEVTFTAGANIQRTYNRNLASANASPVQMKAGVTFTPNTAIASVVARGVTGANNAQVTVPDENPLILKPNTSYVLQLINGDPGAADVGFQINMREQQLSDLSV